MLLRLLEPADGGSGGEQGSDWQEVRGPTRMEQLIEKLSEQEVAPKGRRSVVSVAAEGDQ